MSGGEAAAEMTGATGHGCPNVVLVILDTLRADKLGCYGFPYDVSPSFDRLAENGVRFERVIAQCSWTRPSVGSLLTSHYPRTLGIYEERGHTLPESFETLPRLLKRHGYATFGLTANPNLNSIFNFQHGFDTYVDSNVVFEWMADAGDATLRKDDPLPSAPSLFSRMLDYARRAGPGPHYMQVNCMEVHEWTFRGSMARPEYLGLFRNIGERHPVYSESVRQLTDDLGQFVERLTALPGWEDTLFVFVSDHGEGLDEHAPVAFDRLHGYLLYESLVSVPWVLYRKGWRPARQIIHQPVRLLELLPTVLDALGLPIPGEIEGKSMWPVITGEQASITLPEVFVCETNWRGVNKLGAYGTAWKHFLNRGRQSDLPERELQRMGEIERGAQTNQCAEEAEECARLSAFLDTWEAAHPPAPPVLQTRDFTEEEKRQLESIGYLQ